MVSAESRSGRKIVGNITRGVDLFDALRRVCDEYHVRCGTLTATGSVDQVELASFDQQRKKWRAGRTLSGEAELLQLSGTISESNGRTMLTAHATLMRDRDTGIEIVGGSLMSARAFSVEYVIDSFDDVVLRRTADGDTGLLPWTEAIVHATALAPTIAEPSASITVDPAAIASAAATAIPTTTLDELGPEPLPGAPAWADVIAASTAATTEPMRVTSSPARSDDDNDDEISAEPGDTIVHPRFGTCEILRIEGSYEFAHIRLRNGRIARLSLDIIALRHRGITDGKRVFDAIIA